MSRIYKATFYSKEIALKNCLQFLICRNVDKKFQTNKLFLRVYHSKIYVWKKANWSRLYPTTWETSSNLNDIKQC